mmetsp:Transcript_119063/g.243446  ORF Transcript_119063/g.243446 Transcript_119063/m.243446 type:complete len:91 (-) Transcript_119063:80-352(-)
MQRRSASQEEREEAVEVEEDRAKGNPAEQVGEEARGQTSRPQTANANPEEPTFTKTTLRKNGAGADPATRQREQGRTCSERQRKLCKVQN